MKIKLFTIPNFVTLTNLLCGAASIISALVYKNLEMAFWFIVAAAVCDFLDGFTARLLKQYSEIGVQLDSLADMVSFGVAPSTALYALCATSPMMYEWGEWSEVAKMTLSFVPFLMAAFSALRLAKFNIDDTQHEEFCGLPTPANAILCNSFALVVTMLKAEVAVEWIAMLAVIMSALLVSPIRMFSFKFKSWGLKANILRYLFAISAVVAIIFLQIYAVPVIIVAYIVVSTAKWIFSRAK